MDERTYTRMTLLDRPGLSLDEVIRANYDHSPEEVKSWIE